jgi:hypothetical protein
MSKERPGIPAPISEEVLYRNKHICCICRTPNKHVQIHHIDGNPNNNVLANLAVVCLDCHSLVTGHSGLGRQYAPGEVRKYKKAWEQIIALQSKVYKPPAARVQRELIGQIDIIVCQILSTPDHARRKELLEVLYNIHLWRSTPKIDKQIVEGFSHLAIMSGLSIPTLAKELAKKTWKLCWEFVGPGHAKMDTSDERFVIQCVDVVESIAHFNCIIEQNLAALKAALASAETFFDIAIWYKRKAIAKAVLKVHSEAIRACAFENDFPTGVAALRRSLWKLSKRLAGSRLKWPEIDSKLRSLGRGHQARLNVNPGR